MKISVERILTPEGSIVFIISAKDPHLIELGQIEIDVMRNLDIAMDVLKKTTEEDNNLINEVVALIHQGKEKTFDKAMTDLRFEIKNRLRVKFDPICQEIYNWMFDAQNGPVKQWLQTFDPQRTRYYFDNDPEMNKPQQVDDDEDTECDNSEEDSEDE